MSIDLFSYTNTGSRELNEDYYVIKENGGRYAVLLCDGLGGHNCGEVASKIAAETIAPEIMNLKEINYGGLYEILSRVNSDLIKRQETNPELKGMRTTVVGCVIDNDLIHYFNSGDSRLYIFRNGEMRFMTKDHSVSQMSVELGQMNFDDIRNDTDRSKLIKVLGERITRDIATIYRPEQCLPGDAFLLCSDGFWEYVLENEMEIDLSKSTSAEEWVKFMLIRLLLKMNGKNDNFTVIGGIIK